MKLLTHIIVVIEARRVKRGIPQCTNCRKNGHTKNYCNKRPKCLECVANHQTTECTRKRNDSEVKCVNCNGNHCANCRGCIVHKQLKQKIYVPPRKMSTATNNTAPPSEIVQP